MRVALISLESYYDNSLALDYLASWASGQPDLAAMCEISVFVHPVGRPVSEVLDRVVAWHPDVVGFNCYLWNIGATLGFIQVLSRSLDVTVVLGGMEATYRAERLLREVSAVDFVIQGEGELPFAALLRSLLRCERFGSPVPGLAFRDEERRAVAGGLGASVGNLDDLPSPFLTSTFTASHPKRVLYESYRGCVFHCAFCLYRREYAAQRYFSLTRLQSDLSAILASNVEHIRFVDATFNLNKARTKEILRQLHGCSAEVAVEVSAEFFDEEMISLLPNAGIRHVDIGLQSTRSVALQAVKRDFYRPDRFNANVARLAENSDLRLNIEIIAGLPGDDPAGVLASLQDAVTRWPDHVSIYRLLGLPGTPLERDRESLGLIFAETPPYELIGSSTFSEEDLHGIDRLAFANLILLNSEVGRYALRHYMEFLSMTVGEAYENFVAFVKKEGSYSEEEIVSFGRHHTHGNRSFELLPGGLDLGRLLPVVEQFFVEEWENQIHDHEVRTAIELVDFGYQLAALNLELAGKEPHGTSTGLLRRYAPTTIEVLRQQGCDLGDLEPKEVGGVLFFKHRDYGPAALALDRVLADFLENPDLQELDAESVVELKALGIAVSEKCSSLGVGAVAAPKRATDP